MRRQLLLALAAAALPLLATGAVVLVVGTLSEAPERPAARAYADLLERRALRADVRPEPRAPSVVAPAASPPAAEAAEAEPRFLAAARRIRIERIGVDAALVALNIDADGNMDVPDGPHLVAWYDFTSKPGLGAGNAVFSGHRDWRGHGPAVFWSLGDLRAGDTVEVELVDGTRLLYRVTAAHTYPLGQLDMGEILASTTRESITLITCAGVFAAGDYSDRHIVRAVRTGAVERTP